MSDPSGTEDRRARRRHRRRSLARMTDLSTVGLVFPVAALLGWFGGRAVGGWLGNAEVGALVGLLLGIVAGFYNVFKVALELQKRDREEEATTTAAGPPPDSE